MKITDHVLLWVLHYGPKPLRRAAMRVVTRRCFELAGGIERLTKVAEDNFFWFYETVVRNGDKNGEA